MSKTFNMSFLSILGENPDHEILAYYKDENLDGRTAVIDLSEMISQDEKYKDFKPLVIRLTRVSDVVSN